MITALKFVQGAVAKKDYQPALTHFRIRDGRVMGYNGTIALSSPIALDIMATPKALPFVKAIERCTSDTTVVHLTPGGKLALRSGGFKAFVECTDESEVLDAILPEGEPVQLTGEFIAALRMVEPYIGTDASRPWSNGILLSGASAFATNNIVLAQAWIGEPVPDINLPASAIAELLRIGETPIKVVLSQNSITFFFEGDRWMRTQLLGTEWPDISTILDIEGEQQGFPEGFYDAIETLTPFVAEEGRIYFREGRMSTSPMEGAGASVEIEGLPSKGAYHYKHLMSLKDRVESVAFENHPQPCPFRGPNLRGVILGMVDA